MSHEITVPEEIPVKEVSDEQLEAIKQYYEEYLETYTHPNLTDSATAITSGSYPSRNAPRATEALVTASKMGVKCVELDGVEIPFDDPYKTSSKHTYYFGIHAGGYRLTLEYHDGRGRGYTRLRVTKEEDL